MKKASPLGITRMLATAGLTDFRWVDEEAKWRGSEVHKIIEFASIGTLDRKSVPKTLAGYAEAHRKFVSETGFIALAKYVEKNVESKELGIRGRIDAAGVVGGAPAIVDYKTGVPGPAVALQLALGAHLLEPGKHRLRFAVQLKADGTYRMKRFPVTEFMADLNTALAGLRCARWKLQHGMVFRSAMMVLDPDFDCYDILEVQDADHFTFVYYGELDNGEDSQVVNCYEYSQIRGAFQGRRIEGNRFTATRI